METPGGVFNSQAPGWLNRLQRRFWTGPPHPVARALIEGDEVAGFTVLESPGHSRGHVAFWRESDRVLILGDVLNNINVRTGIPGLHEPPALFTPDPARNRDSARRLAALRPALTCFGHGAPLRDPGRLSAFVDGLPAAVSESIFLADGGLFVPTEHARGPWDPQALHGGAPAALLTAAFERVEPGSELRVARLGFELLRPVPLAPLSLSTQIVRAGRRVQELAGELRSGEQLICRAGALRVQEVPPGLPGVPAAPQDAAAPGPEAMPGPHAGARCASRSRTAAPPASAGARWRCAGWTSRGALGPARVWMRLRHPLVTTQAATPLARAAAVADFGNGVSAVLPFERFLFINADLTIHLQRPPRGEWIGLDARTLLTSGGTGLSESVLHDVHGPVGRAFQTLVVQPR